MGCASILECQSTGSVLADVGEFWVRDNRCRQAHFCIKMQHQVDVIIFLLLNGLREILLLHFVEPLEVKRPPLLFLFIPQRLLNLPQGDVWFMQIQLWSFFSVNCVATLRHEGFERHFFVVVHALDFNLLKDIYSRLLQFSALLQLSKSSGLLEFLFSRFTFSLFTSGVC